MSRTGALILLILVAAAIISGWLKISVPTSPVRQPQELKRSDYFMTDFNLRQYDRQGRLHYQMRGKRMEHYPIDDSALIRSPELSVKPEQPENRWTISAEQAAAPSRALDEIVFSGNVHMRRPSSFETAALSLRTQRLVIKPDAEQLTSDQAVTLNGPGAHIEGHNLNADLKQGIVRLNQVRARYVP